MVVSSRLPGLACLLSFCWVLVQLHWPPALDKIWKMMYLWENSSINNKQVSGFFSRVFISFWCNHPRFNMHYLLRYMYLSDNITPIWVFLYLKRYTLTHDELVHVVTSFLFSRHLHVKLIRKWCFGSSIRWLKLT